jgi:hypothetical protein
MNGSAFCSKKFISPPPSPPAQCGNSHKRQYKDLYLECAERMEAGDQLNIDIDANEDVCSGATADFF